MNDTMKAVATYNGPSSFLISLREQLAKKGSLSEKQIAAAEKFFAPKPVLPASVDLSPLAAFLKAAETNLKWPKLHFEVDGDELVLRLKGQKSNRPGAVDIVSREKVWNKRFEAEMPRWFGRIETDGALVAGGLMTPAIVDVLNMFAADPADAAVKYARKTGNCSFCGRFLETKASVSVGYGPVCAEKYGLPWGHVVEYAVA